MINPRMACNHSSLVNLGGLGVIDKSKADSKHSWLEKFPIACKVSQDSCVLQAACKSPRRLWPVRESFPQKKKKNIYSWHNPQGGSLASFNCWDIESLSNLGVLGSFLLTLRRKISVWRTSLHNKEPLEHFQEFNVHL